jgi:hypothetical protein
MSVVWRAGRQHDIHACADLVLFGSILQACSQGLTTLSLSSDSHYILKSILFHLLDSYANSYMLKYMPEPTMSTVYLLNICFLI